MSRAKVIALFPEASYGAALNCIGIAQQFRARGARPVFICHEHFRGVFSEYGFTEYSLPSSGGGDIAWNDFIERHKDAFRQSPYEQIDSYVVPTWEAIVDTAVRSEEPLRRLIAQIRPDVVVLDNVVMFPAIANAGVPWVRVVSCAETEIPDADVPPYLSGLGLAELEKWSGFRERYLRATQAVHRRFNAFLSECGIGPYAPGEFLPPSPDLNLLLAPEIVRFERSAPLPADRFVYLDGCLRQEAPYALPIFAAQDEQPLVLVSFGSLGAMDVSLIKRLINVFATLPYRFIVNVGPWRDQYQQVPDNVLVQSWFPQPSVVEQSALFIHHGGNNSFCEALYHGVPSLIMPYCWDGHDNAARAMETGVGLALNRYDWQEADLAEALDKLLSDSDMRNRLAANSLQMRAASGAAVAARRILDLV